MGWCLVCLLFPVGFWCGCCLIINSVLHLLTMGSLAGFSFMVVADCCCFGFDFVVRGFLVLALVLLYCGFGLRGFWLFVFGCVVVRWLCVWCFSGVLCFGFGWWMAGCGVAGGFGWVV